MHRERRRRSTPIAASGTAATAVGRKPEVELQPDGAGAVGSDTWISVVVLVDRTAFLNRALF